MADVTVSANVDSILTAADYAAIRTLLGLVISTNVQAYDADLDTWAGLTPSANAQSLVTAANYAAMRTLLGLVIGTNVQAWDADLDTWATLTPSANAQSLVTAANYAAMRTLLGLVIGTNVQAWDADLDIYAGIAPSANVQTLLGAASFAAFKTSLSLGNVENTALSTWAGSANIVTTGTLTTGATGAGFTIALTTSTVTGTLPAAQMPALTGDVTTVAGAVATTIGAGKVTNAMLAGSIDLVTKVTGVLPAANGGTGNAFTFFSGPAGTLRTYTLPNNNVTLTYSGGPVSGTTGDFSGAMTNTVAGAASVPAMKFSGVPFAGTGTTSFPLLYINDANATASTTLSTAGTYFGVNGDGTQDLMNLLKDGTSQFKVSSTGAVTATGTIGSGSDFSITSKSKIQSPANGSLLLTNNAGSSFTALQFGGTTSSFAAIQTSGTGITLGLADGNPGGSATMSGTLAVTSTSVFTGQTTHTGGAIFGAAARLKGYTVATLPAGTQGDTAFVTDSLTPAFLVVVVGGGAQIVTVFYNGTNWIVQ